MRDFKPPTYDPLEKRKAGAVAGVPALLSPAARYSNLKDLMRSNIGYTAGMHGRISSGESSGTRPSTKPRLEARPRIQNAEAHSLRVGGITRVEALSALTTPQVILLDRARIMRLALRGQQAIIVGRRSITAKDNWLHFPSPPSPLPASGAFDSGARGVHGSSRPSGNRVFCSGEKTIICSFSVRFLSAWR